MPNRSIAGHRRPQRDHGLRSRAPLIRAADDDLPIDQRAAHHGGPASAESAAALKAALSRAAQPLTAAAHVHLARALGPLLARPRILQVAVALVGIALVLWTQVRVAVTPVPLPATSMPAEARPVGQAVAGDGAAPETTDDPLEHVAAYNAASIAAGVTGRADVLRPYLAADGPAWQAVAREFTRRAERGEIHQPRLVRWGLVGQTVTATRAMLETQEVWDDETLVGGTLIDARRGLVQRVRYDLRRADPSQPWQIETIESQTMLP